MPELSDSVRAQRMLAAQRIAQDADDRMRATAAGGTKAATTALGGIVGGVLGAGSPAGIAAGAALGGGVGDIAGGFIAPGGGGGAGVAEGVSKGMSALDRLKALVDKRKKMAGDVSAAVPSITL